MKTNKHSSSQDHLVSIKLAPSISTDSINTELISIFQEAKEFGQKLQDLAEHSDPEVRDKVIRLILKL